MPNCPQCSSELLYRDGMRYLNDGSSVQRFLCRSCGFRFSQPNVKINITRKISKSLNSRSNLADVPISNSNFAIKKVLNDSSFSFSEDVASHSDSHESTIEKGINKFVPIVVNGKYAIQDQKSKNLPSGFKMSEIGKTETIAGTDQANLIEYAWKLKKRGLSDTTIKARTYRLKVLMQKGADLQNPDSVETVLATEKWSQANKRFFVMAYQSYTGINGIEWIPIKVRYEPKQPFIPLEIEVDQLIAGCGKKTATFLQTLKDTGARCGEVAKLKWIDVNEKNSTIAINNPEKGSNSRTLKVSAKTIAMINALPKKSDYIFNTNARAIDSVYSRQRNRLARTLQNPRLKQIHFHTLRHFYATMLYHKVRNILLVKHNLGHKRLESTEVYTHLIDFESDEYHSATAKTVKEAQSLIEEGFEYVCDIEDIKLFRKRK